MSVVHCYSLLWVELLAVLQGEPVGTDDVAALLYEF